jgi:hypothetical protein
MRLGPNRSSWGRVMATRQADHNRRKRRGAHKPIVHATPQRIALLIEDRFLHPDLAHDREAIGKAIEDCLDYLASQPAGG